MNVSTKVEILRACTITTLHKFAKQALETLIDAKQRITELATNKDALEKWIGEQLTGMLDDPELMAAIRDFLIAHMYPYRTHYEFTCLGDYYGYLQHSRLIGLDDHWYKSFGEVYCANFSLLYGLEYEYEAVYPHVKPTVDRASYHPDFKYARLPTTAEAPGWFEFFGVDEYGRTRDDIDSGRYVKEMREKIALHERFATPFIYATYGDFRRLGPIETLTSLFRGRWKAPLIPVSSERLAEILSGHGVRARLASLIKEVFHGARAGAIGLEVLRDRASALGSRGRTFMLLYERIVNLFHFHIRQRYEADFDGMLCDLAALRFSI